MNPARKLHILLLLAFVHQFVIGATAKTDSLQGLLGKVPDTQNILILSDLCWEYRFIDRDSARFFGEMALEQSREIGFPKGEAQALNDLGILLIDDNAFPAALDLFDKALKIRQELGDSAGVAALYNKQGIIHQKQGNLEAALDRQLRALVIYEQQEQDLWISYTLNNIAIIHYNLGNLPKSLEYHQRALDLRRELQDTYGIGASYGNMANVYLEMGDTNRAFGYLREAVNWLQETGSSEALGVQMNNLGAIFVSMGELDSARKYLEKALLIRRQLGDSKAIASTLGSLGELYLREGRYSIAEKTLDEALSLARNANVREEQINVLSRLSTLYEETGRLDKALQSLREYVRVKDEVYNDNVNARIMEMQARFDAESQEQQIVLLTSQQQLKDLKIRQQRTQITLLLVFIVMLVGAAFFEYYRYRQKQRSLLQAETMRQQELRMKAVIQAQEEERKRIAEDLHDGVGQTLSGLKLACEGIAEQVTASNSGKDQILQLGRSLDNACSEVRTISHQMRPKALTELGLIPAIDEMLSNTFTHSGISYSFDHFGVEGRFDEKIEVSVYRIIQELVNNIIKHSNATEASFQLLKNNQRLVLVVEDNGKGFDYDQGKGKGIGLLNLDSRVDTVGGEINYESHPGEGTLVTIRIPL